MPDDDIFKQKSWVRITKMFLQRGLYQIVVLAIWYANPSKNLINQVDFFSKYKFFLTKKSYK